MKKWKKDLRSSFSRDCFPLYKNDYLQTESKYITWRPEYIDRDCSNKKTSLVGLDQWSAGTIFSGLVVFYHFELFRYWFSVHSCWNGITALRQILHWKTKACKETFKVLFIKCPLAEREFPLVVLKLAQLMYWTERGASHLEHFWKIASEKLFGLTCHLISGVVLLCKLGTSSDNWRDLSKFQGLYRLLFKAHSSHWCSWGPHPLSRQSLRKARSAKPLQIKKNMRSSPCPQLCFQEVRDSQEWWGKQTPLSYFVTPILDACDLHFIDPLSCLFSRHQICIPERKTGNKRNTVYPSQDIQEEAQTAPLQNLAFWCSSLRKRLRNGIFKWLCALSSSVTFIIQKTLPLGT